MQSIYRARGGSSADCKDKATMDAASIMCQLDVDNDRRLSVDEFVRAATTFSAVVDTLSANK